MTQTTPLAEIARTGRRGAPAAGSTSARTKILRGAGIAFGNKGYADTSVEDILQASDVSRRTFYRFFRNKDDVFEAIYEIASMMLQNTLRMALRLPADPFKRVEQVVDAFLMVQTGAGPIARTLNLEAMRPNSHIAPQRAELIGNLVQIFQDEFEEARGGRVDKFVLRGLMSALEQISLALLDEPARTPDSMERARAAMLRIALATLGEPGEPIPALPMEKDYAEEEV